MHEYNLLLFCAERAKCLKGGDSTEVGLVDQHKLVEF